VVEKQREATRTRSCVLDNKKESKKYMWDFRLLLWSWWELCYYASCSGNSLPTFQNIISVPSSRVKNLDSWILDPWRWDWYVVPKCR